MSWPDQIFKWLGYGTYEASPTTITDGATAAIGIDSKKRVRVAVETSTAIVPAGTTTWVNGKSAGFTHKFAAATAQADVIQIIAQSSYASAGWLQFFNLASAASLSSGVTVPDIAPIRIEANGTASLDFVRPRRFSTGLVWAFSSTAAVYTADAAATVWVDVEKA